MSLGLAIFLSTLVISAVLLYHWGHLRSKQPGFNWRKGLKATGLVVVAFALVGGMFLAYRYYENRPTPQTQYYDLALGLSMEEVLYVKGQPAYVLEDEVNQTHKGWQLVIATDDLSKQAKKKDIKDYLDWQYESETTSHRIDVSFSPKIKKVSKIGCYVNPNRNVYGECELLGITTGMSEETIFDRLGKPKHEKIEGATKIIDYPSLNIVIYLSQKKAYMLLVKAQMAQ